jgi:hypothetical protein
MRPISLRVANAGFQFWNPVKSNILPMRAGFTKQNLNFEKSQELKGRSEIFKNP